MRMNQYVRRAYILSTAVKIANDTSLSLVTPDAVSVQCDVRTSPSTVRRYFFTKADLWKAVASHPDACTSVIKDARKMGII